MQATELDRAVAQVTGESLHFIRTFGFSILEEFPGEIEEEMFFGPNMVDWDDLECSRAGHSCGGWQDVA